MAKQPDDADYTAEVTGYVTPTMKEDLQRLAKVKDVSVSTVVRWALTAWVKEQKR